jgi:hypothetical protein
VKELNRDHFIHKRLSFACSLGVLAIQ